jgi:hypothetical protein
MQARCFRKILPVNGNETPLGRAKNCRVEMFMSP